MTTYLAKTIFPINLCILETVNFYTQTKKLISLNINVLFRFTTTILTRPRWAVGQRVTPLHGYRAVNGDLPWGLWMRAHSLGCLWPGLFWGPGICWMLVRLTRIFLTVCLLITAPSWTIQWKNMYTLKTIIKFDPVNATKRVEDGSYFASKAFTRSSPMAKNGSPPDESSERSSESWRADQLLCKMSELSTNKKKWMYSDITNQKEKLKSHCNLMIEAIYMYLKFLLFWESTFT